jgi:hypothetical protein
MFDPIQFIKELNKKKIRYLLIGRHAVIQYGAPLFSMDYDFWVHPDEKKKLLKLVEDDFEGELSHAIEEKKPIYTAYIDDYKIDLFFVRKITNLDGETLSFDSCYKNSIVKSDPDGAFYIRLPEIDDLIILKKMGNRPKDLEDIEYLKSIKKEKLKK